MLANDDLRPIGGVQLIARNPGGAGATVSFHLERLKMRSDDLAGARFDVVAERSRRPAW